jgi:tetratricopeptide (TPR) repeat protein
MERNRAGARRKAASAQPCCGKIRGEETMMAKWRICSGLGLAALILAGGKVSLAQTGGQYSTPGQQQQPQQNKDKKPAVEPLSLDKGTTTAPPVNAEEDAAFKAYSEIPASDAQKKIASGEAFVQKYPQSRYRPAIYAPMVVAYVQLGQVDRMETVGDQAIELTPTDLGTLAVVSSTLPRAINSKTVEPDKKLAKAERYAKQAIEIAPTLPKPEAMTDGEFVKVKNQYLAMAHSGLGVAYFQRGKYAEAIPELDQSTKIDPSPDPVNFYLLGISNQKTSHFDDAVAAYTKCAAMASSLQPPCKAGMEEAKKQGATQLSAPK